MLDKNGVKVKAGDIVRVEGGYFNNSNGLFFVIQDGTNPGNLADDTRVTLLRLCKNGRLSKAKDSLCMFPPACYCNDRMKRMVVRRWNAEHAAIEVVEGTGNEHVLAWFREKAESFRKLERQQELMGFSDVSVKLCADTAKWHEDVAARLTA